MQHFAETSKRARATIAEQGERFITSGSTVLCHGHSRVVLSILRRAAASVSAAGGLGWSRRPTQLHKEAGPDEFSTIGKAQADCTLNVRSIPNPSQGKQFRVVVTEGRPDETGLTMARVLEELKVCGATDKGAVDGAGGEHKLIGNGLVAVTRCPTNPCLHSHNGRSGANYCSARQRRGVYYGAVSRLQRRLAHNHNPVQARSRGAGRRASMAAHPYCQDKYTIFVLARWAGSPSPASCLRGAHLPPFHSLSQRGHGAGGRGGGRGERRCNQQARD